jgi:hypothetical protein
VRVTVYETGPLLRSDHHEDLMESVYLGIAGIDVHKKMLAVVIRQTRGDATTYIQRKFGATKSDISHLAAWLGAWGQKW